jgi:CheY-like chemotaxis protein
MAAYGQSGTTDPERLLHSPFRCSMDGHEEVFRIAGILPKGINMIRVEYRYQKSTDVRHVKAPASLMEEQCGTKTIKRPLVSIVDDDESVRESLPDLVRELGFAAQAFSSAREFLASGCASETGCLILDIMMPGMSGPELQEELERRSRHIPIVFITAQTSETLRAQMLAHGAVDCLIKPFSDTALLDALNSALRAN